MASKEETIIINKTNSQKTIWEHSTHLAFIELCLDEMKKGNRRGSHFNKVGWVNLIKNMKERVGKDFTKAQLKNHWEAMKRDCKLFERLMRIESGLCWDPVRKTIDATPEWWDEKIKADPYLAKFRDKNLEIYHQYYELLFCHSVAVWDKAKDDISYDVEKNMEVTDIKGDGDSDDINVGDGIEIQFPESSTIRIKKAQLQENRTRSKKRNRHEPSTSELKLDMVLRALSSRSTQIFPSRRLVWSITECMDIVASFPGFEPGSDNYNKAIKVFFSKEAREGFMIPPTNIDKIKLLYSLFN